MKRTKWVLLLTLMFGLCLPSALATANTSPIYTLTPTIAWSGAVTAANSALDGTGTVYGICTAGSNGAYVQRIRIKALGTNIATVMRIFINNGSASSTATNNVLYGELSLP